MKNFVKVYEGEPNTRILNSGYFDIQLYDSNGAYIGFYDNIGYTFSRSAKSERGLIRRLKRIIKDNPDLDINYISAISRYIDNDIYFVRVDD